MLQWRFHARAKRLYNNITINFYSPEIKIVNDRVKVHGNIVNAFIESGHLGKAQKKTGDFGTYLMLAPYSSEHSWSRVKFF